MHKPHYKSFSENAVFAARMLQYYLTLNDRIFRDKAVQDVVNNNARFWKDYNYAALESVVIALGRIFGTHRTAHSVEKLLKALGKSLPYFLRGELRKRKLLIGAEFDGIDDYIKNAHELSANDLVSIQLEANKAKALWDKIKPLRDKIFAHSEILDEDKRAKLYQDVKYSDLEEIIQILLNITHAIEQAELNGRKPDFGYNYEAPKKLAEAEMDRLLNTLTR